MEESYLIITKFVIKVQLKYLTHMFCPLMSSYELYKKMFFLLISP